MKTKVNEKAKKYCYQGNCSYVITGLHMDQYPVCSVCHEEITERLKESIDERNTIKDEQLQLFDELDNTPWGDST